MCTFNQSGERTAWCGKYIVPVTAAETKDEAKKRAENSSQHPKLILEVQAIYDFSLPATTVVFYWVSRDTWKVNNGNHATKYRRLSPFIAEHAFSLSRGGGISAKPVNGWWQIIRTRITAEADRQKFGFLLHCRWLQVNAPRTEHHAFVRQLASDEIADVNRGFPGQSFGRLDLRSRLACSKPIAPYWQEPMRDRTPLKNQEKRARCETCNQIIARHPKGAKCPGLQIFYERKARWLTWYRKTFHREPIHEGYLPFSAASIDPVHFLRDLGR